jgi:hypothetical protein
MDLHRQKCVRMGDAHLRSVDWQAHRGSINHQICHLRLTQAVLRTASGCLAPVFTRRQIQVNMADSRNPVPSIAAFLCTAVDSFAPIKLVYKIEVVAGDLKVLPASRYRRRSLALSALECAMATFHSRRKPTEEGRTRPLARKFLQRIFLQRPRQSVPCPIQQNKSDRSPAGHADLPGRMHGDATNR